MIRRFIAPFREYSIGGGGQNNNKKGTVSNRIHKRSSDEFPQRIFAIVLNSRGKSGPQFPSLGYLCLTRHAFPFPSRPRLPAASLHPATSHHAQDGILLLTLLGHFIPNLRSKDSPESQLQLCQRTSCIICLATHHEICLPTRRAVSRVLFSEKVLPHMNQSGSSARLVRCLI